MEILSVDIVSISLKSPFFYCMARMHRKRKGVKGSGNIKRFGCHHVLLIALFMEI